jgi:nitrogenase molybdenum-iron protein NifN
MELLFGIGNLFLEAEEARVKQFQEFGIVGAEF